MPPMRSVLRSLYAEDAVNHQVANKPVVGKTAIHEMFANEFVTAEMVCIVENIFEDGEWAIMEWKDQARTSRMWIFSCEKR